MIQRIQSVYFFIAFLLVSIPLIGLTFFSYSLNKVEYHITAFGIENTLNPEVTKKGYFVLIMLIAVLLLGAIFFFKNRKRQIMLSWLALILNLSTTAWIITMSIGDSMSCTKCESADIVPRIGLFLFSSAFIFILLGYNGVKKDKKLVDSLNRLR